MLASCGGPSETRWYGGRDFDHRCQARSWRAAEQQIESMRLRAELESETPSGEIVDRGVVVAHDYLTQRGGAERVALEISRALKARYLVTSTFEPTQTFEEFSSVPIRTSFLARIPLLRRDPRIALPLLPLVWRSFRPIDAEFVICSSSGFAHGLRTTSSSRKIVYCHNTARWLYQPGDYFQGRSTWVRLAVATISPLLRAWDLRAARSADIYLANSTLVARRIYDAYGIQAKIVHPPICIDTSDVKEEVLGLTPGYYLSVGRPRGYKGTSELIRAFRKLEMERLVIVGGKSREQLASNIWALGSVPESKLRWLYLHARALISVSREDFGLTSLEANAFGTPSLVLRCGGFLDTTSEGVSGCFIDEISVDSITWAIRNFPKVWDRSAIIEHAARFSREQFTRQLLSAIVT